MNRILLVEDEENIRETVRLNLELEGHKVIALGDGTSAVALIAKEHFDLIILDVMLPDVDGFQICEEIRLHNSQIPIIFVTAKDEQAERIKGLRIGADDYLTKPFDLEELLIRVEKLLQRAKRDIEKLDDIYRFGSFTINFHSFEADTLQGKVTLTKKESMLLKLLIERKEQVVSRQQILKSVWGYDVFPSTRTIDNFILSFRKFFEADPKHPQHFHSVRSVGYRFTEVAPPEPEVEP